MVNRLVATEDDLRLALEEQLLRACEPVGTGLHAWVVDDGHVLEIKGVVVEAEHRGSWAFARWMLRLPKDRKVIAVQVTNERLAQTFVRCGFHRAHRFDADLDRWEVIYVRHPAEPAE
jgi:hypothetical protein